MPVVVFGNGLSWRFFRCGYHSYMMLFLVCIKIIGVTAVTIMPNRLAASYSSFQRGFYERSNCD